MVGSYGVPIVRVNTVLIADIVRGDSSLYPQCMFSRRNKKNIYMEILLSRAILFNLSIRRDRPEQIIFMDR